MQDTFIADKPKLGHIALFITGRCTLACEHCLASNLPKEDLDFEEIKKVLDDISTNSITITGGEPTLHPRFKEIVLLASKYAKHITIGTNGQTTNENLEKAREQWSWLPKNVYFLISEDDLHSNAKQNGIRNTRIKNLIKIIAEKELGYQIRTTVETTTQANLLNNLERFNLKPTSYHSIAPQGDGYYLVQPASPQVIHSSTKQEKKTELTIINNGNIFWGNPFLATLTEESPFYIGNIKTESIHRILERYAVMLLYTNGLKYNYLGLFKSLKDAIKLRRAIKRRGQKKIMLETYRTMEPPKRMHYKPKV